MKPLGLRHGPSTLLLACTLLALLAGATLAHADEGWVINNFEAQVQVHSDGSLMITETLLVDFRGLRRHGILRDIPIVYEYDQAHQRVYKLDIRAVTDTRGRPHEYETSREGSFLRIKIGDPDATISGEQSYVISYTVVGALNSFPQHDELFWNATGLWPVALESVRVLVELPRDGIREFVCFQGPTGSMETCVGESGGRAAEFQSTRVLPENQQLTLAIGFNKGIVPEPAPILEPRPRDFKDFFEITPYTVGGSAGVLLGVVGFLGWIWWNQGRDRRFLTIHYLTEDTREEVAPLLASDPVVIEYQPPEKLRPAVIGVLHDERADTLDATATIIDLAARGHLHITEVDKKLLGMLDIGGNDWRFTRKHNSQDTLLPYEEKLLEGLFQNGDYSVLSDLKTKFHGYLKDSQDLLYDYAYRRKFFPNRPDRVRTRRQVLGAGVLGVGLVVLLGLGAVFGAGLLGVPMVLGGALIVALASAMPRRSAMGREMLRRTLGFRKYLAAAETERQRYNEDANIFATYLPYAMVFRCVDKWATTLGVLPAAEGAASAAGYYSEWYTGSGPGMDSRAFSNSLRGLSSDISSVIVSTPGGSGGSGFSGGFSGGGGGGGGGGSW